MQNLLSHSFLLLHVVVILVFLNGEEPLTSVYRYTLTPYLAQPHQAEKRVNIACLVPRFLVDRSPKHSANTSTAHTVSRCITPRICKGTLYLYLHFSIKPLDGPVYVSHRYTMFVG